MVFHVTQPGSSIATSLINAEAKPKHVLLLEIKVSIELLMQHAALTFKYFFHCLNYHAALDQGTQYRPTKIPLQSVRPFEYAEVIQFLIHFFFSQVNYIQKMSCRLYWKTR